jgi:hypothetical protein
MWFTREHIVTFLIGAVFILFQLDGLGQFNRYYSHDRDSTNTDEFRSVLMNSDEDIIAFRGVAEYFENSQYQLFQYYLEKYNQSGDRLTKIQLNPYFALDSVHQLWIYPSLVMNSFDGYSCYGGIFNHDSNSFEFVSIHVASNLDSLVFDTVVGLPMNQVSLGTDLGNFKKDSEGGFLFVIDIPDTPLSYFPGKNVLVHLDEQGRIDWHRIQLDKPLIGETYRDVVRHPISKDIYICGNEAKMIGSCPNTPANRDCENYAFVYRCDSLGQNCTRIYYAQDSVDAHQECNFIQVLSDGNIAVFHPIVDVEARVKLSSGTPRIIIMNEDGQIQKEIISTFPYSILKFQAFFETELNRYQFISSTAWEIPGNQGPTGQIYNHTYEVGVYDNETYLGSQGIYIPEHISINSIYNLHSAQRLTDGRILVAGRMTHDSLNTTLPYMALSDTEGCFPEIPCVAVGVEDEELEIPNKQLTVYPNPAQNELNVILSGNSEVLLLDLNGRTIQSWQGQQGENLLELQGVSGGMYILKTATQTARVVVK